MCQPRPSWAMAGIGCHYVDPVLARLAKRSCRLHTSLLTKHVHIDINIQYQNGLFNIILILRYTFGKILCG